MSLALTVMLIEATNDQQYVVPVTLVVYIANAVSSSITASLYDSQLERLNMPMIDETPANMAHKVRGMGEGKGRERERGAGGERGRGRLRFPLHETFTHRNNSINILSFTLTPSH